MASDAPLAWRQPRGRRDVLRLGLGAAAAVLIAACTTSEDDAPEEEPTPEVTPTAAPVLSFAPMPAIPTVATNGLLRLATVGEPEVPSALVYSTLVTVDPRDAHIHGDLAGLVEQPDPLTLTCALDGHATFHPAATNGTSSAPEPLDAGEVARDFAIRADAGEFLFTEVIEEATAIDPMTLQLRLHAPYALLLDQLGDAGTAGVRADAPSTVGIPLGSGPFIAERNDDGSLTLRPHAGYHRLGLPLLRSIHVATAERERTLGAAFAGGALDILELTSPDSVDRAAERSDARVLTRSSRRARGLGLSLVESKGGRDVRFHPAFQDHRVRRAIALAIDREAIAAYDDSTAAGPVGPAFAGDALDPLELEEHELFQHDPREAARLLQAAGEEGLTFSLMSALTQPLRGLVQLIARQLREAGIEPVLDLVDAAGLQASLEQGDFEAILFELEAVRSPDIGLRLHVSGGLDGVSPWGYSNPVYDDAVRTALGQVDPVARAEASRAAQLLLLEDVPAMLALPEPVERIAVAGAVGGYEYDAYDFNERGLAPLWHVGSGSTSAPHHPAAIGEAL
ncbi:MAG: ABC transporter substrate-binding protein [Chloroflexi bacterium]|nr:ABC transporter substrate-binding protein [Chloroflexota bacterium]